LDEDGLLPEAEPALDDPFEDTEDDEPLPDDSFDEDPADDESLDAFAAASEPFALAAAAGSFGALLLSVR